jgi:hypothetical protein
MKRAWLLAGIALGALAIGCTSPEAGRQRAGGPGADVGNHREVVEMHEGSWPYYRTARIVRRGPDLEPARQAQRLSEQGK